MKAATQVRERTSVERKRRPPSAAWTRRVPWAGKGELEAAPAIGPVELVVEATNAEGELSTWFDDFWWVDVLTLYKKRAVTIHLAPTPGALLSPAVLHQFEMLRRVEPQWKSVAHVFAQDLPEEAAAALSVTPYHEIRIIESHLAASRPAGSAESIDAVVENLRTQQPGVGGRKPMLTRVTERDATASRIIGAAAQR